MMKKILMTLTILFVTQPGSAHQLPQKIHPQIENNTVTTETMNFGEQKIEQWLQYANTLNIAAIAKQVNIPGLISYKSSTITKSDPEIECSIYLDQHDDKLGGLCGDIDRHALFLNAGLSAIGYCHHTQQNLARQNGNQKPLVPYFIGPNSFISSINESTDGAHHNNYETSHGIQFHCVEAYSPLEPETPLSEAQDI